MARTGGANIRSCGAGAAHGGCSSSTTLPSLNSSSGSGSAGSSGTYSVSSSRALSSKSVFAPAVSSAVTRWRRVIGRDVASDGSLRFEPGAAGARAVEAAVLICALVLWRECSLAIEPRTSSSTMALSLLHVALAQNLPLPPLPYDYAALEPHIDESTMREHHLKHHQKYTDSLNGALAKLRADAATKHLAKMGVDTLLQHLAEIPDEATRRTVQNAGGGYVNHDFFFRSMAPDGGGEPQSERLSAALVASFGGSEAFRRIFTVAALEVFGSGWAWLVYDTSAKALSVTSSANQDTPLMEPGKLPLLGIDVWEHAYYLKHQSKRAGYVADFFKVVDWSEVARRLDAATGGGKSEL